MSSIIIPKLISENPFRVLGVYANAAKRDIVANKAKAAAFLKVGKSVEYPTDFAALLGTLPRSLETMSEAESRLSIAKEQIKYMQFWFLKLTPIDEIAFGHLETGNGAKAVEVWQKRDAISSLQNRMLYCLCKGEKVTGLAMAYSLYAQYADTYLQTLLPDSTITLSPDELETQFLEGLIEVFGLSNLLSSLQEAEREVGADLGRWVDRLKTLGVTPLIEKLSKAVERAKHSDAEDAKSKLQAAKHLITATKPLLGELKNLLTAQDVQYQLMADKVGLAILDCAIAYYNKSDDENAAQEALRIQSYAGNIVEGDAAKRKCEENVKELQEIIDRQAPKEVKSEDIKVKAALVDCSLSEHTIRNAIKLLEAAKEPLQQIKKKLGDSHQYYLLTSNAVVKQALDYVVEEVNKAVEDIKANSLLYRLNFDFEYRSSSLSLLKFVLSEAWRATKLMDDFDLVGTFRAHYGKNRATLESLCNDMGVSTKDVSTASKGKGSSGKGLSTTSKGKGSSGKGLSPASKGKGSSTIEVPPPPEVAREAKIIREALRKFVKLPDEIAHSVTLLNETYPVLQEIKQRIGAVHPYYLKVSTDIVKNAWHNVVAELNEAQKSLVMARFESTFERAWEPMRMMVNFDLEADFKAHYQKERTALTALWNSVRENKRKKIKEESEKKRDFRFTIGCLVICVIIVLVNMCSR